MLTKSAFRPVAQQVARRQKCANCPQRCADDRPKASPDQTENRTSRNRKHNSRNADGAGQGKNQDKQADCPTAESFQLANQERFIQQKLQWAKDTEQDADRECDRYPQGGTFERSDPLTMTFRHRGSTLVGLISHTIKSRQNKV